MLKTNKTMQKKAVVLALSVLTFSGLVRAAMVDLNIEIEGKGTVSIVDNEASCQEDCRLMVEEIHR